jgi:hypothetical protein
MHFSNNYIIFLIIIITYININCEKSVDPENHVNTENNIDLVQMQIDFQLGFAGYHVKIKFNEDEYFKAYVNPASPLAGPEAWFITFLPRGKNLVYIAGTEQGWSPDKLAFEDEKMIDIGKAEKYYIGLIRPFSDDTVRISLQENPFYYLKNGKIN